MALSERIERNVDLSSYDGQIPVNYLYTYGLGLEKFFRAVMENGDFLASRCPSCGAVYFPCRVFCERCFAGIDKTFKVPGTGTVFSYTVSHYGMDGSAKKEPDVVGLIEMDGCEGAKFVHLLNAKPEKVKIGMKVKAVLATKAQRKGGITDIRGFMPV